MSEEKRYVTIRSEHDEDLMFTVNGQYISIKSNVPHWLTEEEIDEI